MKVHKILSLILLSIMSVMIIGCDFNEKNDVEKDEIIESSVSDENENRIQPILYNSDINKNGKDDVIDIINGAKSEVDNKVIYKSTYCSGGYPPENEGVCTDVVWRSLKNAGIDLKKEIDIDIKNNLNAYKNSVAKPDPNIDFRRVKNQKVFFDRKYIKLTTVVDPNDPDNLKEWQPGDIVIKDHADHVAIISDKIEENGVPYVLHNYYNHASEDDYLYDWYKSGYILGHYRLDTSKYQ